MKNIYENQPENSPEDSNERIDRLANNAEKMLVKLGDEVSIDEAVRQVVIPECAKLGLPVAGERAVRMYAKTLEELTKRKKDGQLPE